MHRTIFAAAAALWLLPLTALAVPLALSNQGNLQDSDGIGLTGSHELTFSLYDDADATNPALWTETLTVAFANGTYSVVLGNTSVIDSALLDQYPLYLGLSVDGGADMAPRHEIVSVPYSILADTAWSVDGGPVNASSVTVGDTVIDSTGISVDGTTVIDTSGAFVGTPPDLPDLGCTNGQLLGWDTNTLAWVCTSEGDPQFALTVAAGITGADLADWDAAYGWGDHANAGYITSYSETDPTFAASPVGAVTATQVSNWEAAYGYGDHASAGYLTSYSETDPTFSASPVGGVTTTQVSNWETAYGWGNHNSAGYLTSYAETDPTFGASPVGAVTSTQISNWEAAYGYGNHASAGYLTSYSETDPAFTASPAAGIGNGDIATWNTAAGYGNHASAGYLTSFTEIDPFFLAFETGGGTITGDITINGAQRELIISNTGSETEAGIQLVDGDAPTTQYANILFDSNTEDLRIYVGSTTPLLTMSDNTQVATFSSDVVIGGTTFSGCPTGWLQASGGRLCMEPVEQAATDMHSAIGVCVALQARVCTHNDFQTMCGTGINPYTSTLGWYGDHARVETSGNTDDEYLSWNRGFCDNNNDGPAFEATATSLPFKCCW